MAGCAAGPPPISIAADAPGFFTGAVAVPDPADHCNQVPRRWPTGTPRLLARLRALPWAQIGVAAPERARIETRTISVVNLHPYPDLRGEFFPPRRASDQARPSTSTTASRRTVKTVTVYTITSLNTFQTDPVLLAGWIRGC